MCYCLDLRGDSKLAKFLSHAIIAVLVAGSQLIMWGAFTLTQIAPPEYVKEKQQSLPAGTTALIVILFLAGALISVLLLVGIFKKNRIFIQVFLVYTVVMLVIFIVGIITNIFTQPTQFGLSGVFFGTFIVLFEVLSYFIIRNYYLGLTSRPTGQTQNLNPRGLRV